MQMLRMVKIVTISGISIGAADASNYTLQNTSTTTTANISEAVLQIIANADAKFVTENDTPGYKGVSYFGFVGSEDNSVLGGSLSMQGVMHQIMLQEAIP